MVARQLPHELAEKGLNLPDFGSIVNTKDAATGNIALTAQPADSGESITIGNTGVAFTSVTFDFYANGGSYTGANTGVEKGGSTDATATALAVAINAHPTFAPLITALAVTNVAATGDFSFTGQPLAGETVSVGHSASLFDESTFEFYSNGGAYGGAFTGVELGGTVDDTVTNLTAAIEADAVLILYLGATADLGNDSVDLAFDLAGPDGNLVTLGEAATNCTASAATLTGGAGSVTLTHDVLGAGGNFVTLARVGSGIVLSGAALTGGVSNTTGHYDKQLVVGRRTGDADSVVRLAVFNGTPGDNPPDDSWLFSAALSAS